MQRQKVIIIVVVQYTRFFFLCSQMPSGSRTLHSFIAFNYYLQSSLYLVGSLVGGICWLNSSCIQGMCHNSLIFGWLTVQLNATIQQRSKFWQRIPLLCDFVLQIESQSGYNFLIINLKQNLFALIYLISSFV